MEDVFREMRNVLGLAATHSKPSQVSECVCYFLSSSHTPYHLLMCATLYQLHPSRVSVECADRRDHGAGGEDDPGV